jgi:hypothetical protein
VNEFPTYELDWILLPSCQEFRYLPMLLRLGSLEFHLCIHTFVGEEQNRCMTYSIDAEVGVGIGKLG